MKIFAQRLKQKREDEKLTQDEFAKELGIPLKTYQNYEAFGSGHRMPSYENIIKIANALNVTVDYLLGND